MRSPAMTKAGGVRVHGPAFARRPLCKEAARRGPGQWECGASRRPRIPAARERTPPTTDGRTRARCARSRRSRVDHDNELRRQPVIATCRQDVAFSHAIHSGAKQKKIAHGGNGMKLVPAIAPDATLATHGDFQSAAARTGPDGANSEGGSGFSHAPVVPPPGRRLTSQRGSSSAICAAPCQPSAAPAPPA